MKLKKSTYKKEYRRKAVRRAAFFIAVLTVFTVTAVFLSVSSGTGADVYAAGPSARGGPDPPEQVKAASYSTSKIRVSWQLSEGAEGYEVYRAASRKGPYKLCFAVKDPEKDWYINTGRTPGKTYWYKVRAYEKTADGGRRYSDYSGPVHAYARPGKVKITGLTSEGWIDRSFHLTWKPVSGADGYQISMKELTAGDFRFCGNFRQAEGRMELPDKTKEYVLRVRAYKKAGDRKVYGEFSEEVSYGFDWDEEKLQQYGEAWVKSAYPDMRITDGFGDGTARTPYNSSWSAAWPLRFSRYEPWNQVKKEVEEALAEDFMQYGQVPETVTVCTEEAEPLYVHMYLLH